MIECLFWLRCLQGSMNKVGHLTILPNKSFLYNSCSIKKRHLRIKETFNGLNTVKGILLLCSASIVQVNTNTNLHDLYFQNAKKRKRVSFGPTDSVIQYDQVVEPRLLSDTNTSTVENIPGSAYIPYMMYTYTCIIYVAQLKRQSQLKTLPMVMANQQRTAKQYVDILLMLQLIILAVTLPLRVIKANNCISLMICSTFLQYLHSSMNAINVYKHVVNSIMYSIGHICVLWWILGCIQQQY